MFRAIISPIFRSTRLCVTACRIKPGSGVPPLPGYRPATSCVLYTTSCNTQSSAPEDGRNYHPKHVELIGIINKPLLFRLVGCLYYFFYMFRSYVMIIRYKNTGTKENTLQKRRVRGLFCSVCTRIFRPDYCQHV